MPGTAVDTTVIKLSLFFFPKVGAGLFKLGKQDDPTTISKTRENPSFAIRNCDYLKQQQ